MTGTETRDTLPLAMTQNRATVPDAVLSELAASASYFREHLEAASADLETARTRLHTSESNEIHHRGEIQRMNKVIADFREERRQIARDVARSRRSIDLERQGIDPWRTGQEGPEGFSAWDGRLARLAEEGFAALVEEKAWNTIVDRVDPVAP